jgi:hypothetical protein
VIQRVSNALKRPDSQATCFPPTPHCEPHHKHTTSYCFVLLLPHPPILNRHAPARLHVQLPCLASITGSTFGLRSARATWTTGASCWAAGGRTAQTCARKSTERMNEEKKSSWRTVLAARFVNFKVLFLFLRCMRTHTPFMTTRFWKTYPAPKGAPYSSASRLSLA